MNPASTTTAGAHRVGRLQLALFLSALFAAVFAAGAASASSGGAEAAARAAAQKVIARTTTQLRGASVGAPVLVRSVEDMSPQYFLVPVSRGAKVIGVVGVSPDGREWQWYTPGFTGRGFPSVAPQGASLRAGLAASEPMVLVAGRDRQLYWAASSGSGKLVSADDPTRVRTRQQALQSAGDVRPGAYALQEATDPVRRSGGTAFSPEGQSVQATALPTAKNLTVPHYYQVNSYYCGPATLQMLFAKYRPVIGSQGDIAAVMNAKGWGTWWGAYADDLVRTARFSYLSTAVQDPQLTGFKERLLGYGAVVNAWSDGGSSDPDYANRYTDLKTLISQGYPVVMLTWYDGQHKVGHFRVLKGYDDNTGEFIVNDPWYSAPYYGPDVRFNQSFLVDNLWTQYYRWGAVIAPWYVSVTAPSSVAAGSQFTVSAYISYRGPGKLAGRAPVSSSAAGISLPSGFTADSYTRSLPNITATGSYQRVSWTVTAPTYAGASGSITVSAKGQITGSSTSYQPSYTDWIGGTASASVAVSGGFTSGAAPALGSVSPSALSTPPDSVQTLAAPYSDQNGVSDLRTVMLLVNDSVTGSNGLYAAYSLYSNKIYLRKADNSDWLPGVALGTDTVLDNGYAKVYPARTTVTRSGNTLTVRWAASMSERSSGRAQNVYLQAEDKSGRLADWQQRGTWTVNRPASAGNVAGVGAVVTPEVTASITSTYSDPDGWSNIASAQVLVNTSLTGAGSVWLRYDAPKNQLYLRSGDNTTWLGPVTPGISGVLDNGRVALLAGQSRVSSTGDNLTVKWGLKFHQSFSGRTYSLYSVAADRFTPLTSLPWVKKGSYTVSSPPRTVAITPTTGQSLPGALVTYEATYRDADPGSQIGDAALIVNSRLNGSQAVYARYNAATNKLYLCSDSCGVWLGGITPGTASTVSNSYATLHASATTVSRQTGEMVVRWAVSYRLPYSGKLYGVYSFARDTLGANAWSGVGKWVVNRPPRLGTVTPRNSSSPAGSWVTFSSTYYDDDGASNLSQVMFIINSVAGGYHGFHVRYDSATNKIWMRKADLSGWIGGVQPGTKVVLRTGYAALDVGATTLSRSGATLTIRWRVALGTGMRARSLNEYLSAQDKFGARTGLRAVGTWKVN